MLAFSRLGTTRTFSADGGFGPIPWTAAREYAAEFELSPLMRTFFCDVMLLLDAAYREHVRKQQGEQRAHTGAERAGRGK